MAIARSDQRLAALVYHGWTLKSAPVHAASGTVPEYYLEWELPEAVRRPTAEEGAMFSQLSIVDDVFEVPGRGIVITLGNLRFEDAQRAQPGDFVVLQNNQSACLAEIRGRALTPQSQPDSGALVVAGDFTKTNVRSGMVVWIRGLAPPTFQPAARPEPQP